MRINTSYAGIKMWTDLLTYRLDDFILFSPDAYDTVFRSQNEALWPYGHFAALAAYICICLATIQNSRPLANLATSALVLAHLWIAFGFMMQYYLPINYIAKGFAGGFAFQSLLIMWAVRLPSTLFGSPKIKKHKSKWRTFGVSLLVIAGLLPLLEMALGRPAAASSLFALTPDPTTIAFIGVVLISGHAISRAKRALLLAWPALWCLISGLTLIGLNNLSGIGFLFIAFMTPVFALTGRK
jgi:Family of unknown function (DUF6064)